MLVSDLDINNEVFLRRKKLLLLRKQGVAFPNDFRRNFVSNQLFEQYGKKSNQELLKLNIEVNVAGRMVSRRIMGKASFVTLQDMTGCLQLYVVYNKLPAGLYNKEFKKWDLGDILGACGFLFKTRTGELSVFCTMIRLLTKAIRPLPNKFHGLIDQEIRYRQRYLDLISNEKSRKIFKIRSLILVEIRKFMLEHDFMEVETPIMQNIPGGASARPFITNHNALNINLYLRISPELYLKRLVVGGFEKVFEINRNFRNEGLSSYHNPEFTMMEIYMAYADYRDLIILIEKLFCVVSQRVLGTSCVKYGDWIFDFGKPFIKMTMKEAIHYYKPEMEFQDIDDRLVIISMARSLGIKINPTWGVGRIQTAVFEESVVRHLIQPTFITSYPVEVSPLARRNDNDCLLSDRFEFFCGGYEIGNGFSELNDAEDQKSRFIKQSNNGKNNDVNHRLEYDEDYIVALEHGLPPTAGVGIGIDRLVMLFTNTHTIRDVILFPILRKQK
ncbi:lysine--tRNA ligase [Blochmannia endosymbiont of Camponotus (Colobopsis) obliquus]|uniref:lysine--tRNA ligase n=1 Tax=Blochmannia endosymbiont of Camponotus (Colobopsis) obliquus TaxID=1505597 RepID=UPI00061B156B|nr:lysine--tRNA ligase [Blochmannia endosymbiont of Camponotus (Colobopsis) obliquus]